MNELYTIPSGMVACTPSDTADISQAYKGIWLESGGNLAVLFTDGTTHVYSGLVKHQELWGEFKRVLSTGTTITSGNVYLMKATRMK